MITIWTLIIGGLAGYLAAKIMKGSGNGLILNIIVGIIGGWLGGWLFSLLGIQSTGGLVGELLVGTVGAVVLLWIVAKLR